jgi:hypothetical protein
MGLTVGYSAHLLRIAEQAAKKAREDAAARPDALTADSLIAIIMAVTSAEAFINELAERLDSLPEGFPISESLKSFAAVVKEVEGDHGPVTLKYLVASHALGRMFDKGAPPFQDFAHLARLRNALVHLKPDDTRGPKGAEALAQRDLAHKKDYDLFGWVARLEKPETAEWAVGAAREIMRAVLALTRSPSPRRPTRCVCGKRWAF